jgi:alpha-beta hydrolase superfamily lysophospholipase
MTEFSAGSSPDATREPRGPIRGNVIVLAGLHERAADFALLTDQLLLTGFRVTVFDDVSVDVEASRRGVLRVLRDGTLDRPLFLIGSDLGAVLAAGLIASGEARVAAAVLGDLVTPASRPSTVTVADFSAVEVGGEGPAEARLPVGIRLADAHDVLVPSLVFHGDSDDVTGIEDAVSWASQLPFGSLRVVPQGDHHVLTGAERRTVAAAIVLFLERQRAGRPVLVDGFAAPASRER